MKTLAIIFALVSGTPGITISAPNTELKGLHFVITTTDGNLNSDDQKYICDTMENAYALFKSKDYILACKNNNLWNEKGIATEVKAYFNSEEISIDDAYAMMNNKNMQEAQEYAEYSRQRIEEIMKENDKINMYYSITVSMKNNSEMLKSYTEQFAYALKTSGNNEMIVFGKFVTFNDVKQIYDELTESGAVDISITASEFGKDIPVSNAVGKEQQYLQQLLAINE